MMKHGVHVCGSMHDGYLPNQPTPYSYRWAGHHGWCLYFNDVPGAENRWCYTCDWCCEQVPMLDPLFHEAKNNPWKLHRCERLVKIEWCKKRAEVDCFYLIEWDGYQWLHTNDGSVLEKHLKVCPYCTISLPDPRTFPSKVEIA